jgi:hypothetical protein
LLRATYRSEVFSEPLYGGHDLTSQEGFNTPETFSAGSARIPFQESSNMDLVFGGNSRSQKSLFFQAKGSITAEMYI